MARRLKNWLRSYLHYTEQSEAPPKFHFWSGVSAIAGALRRKVWIDMGGFKWTPNFYIFFVAAPGIAKKSTTANLSMGLLHGVDGVKFGPKSVTWQALLDSLQGAKMDWAPDGITGKLYPMSCLTIVASELGIFFDPANREMVDVLVDLWDGNEEAWGRRTKKEGEAGIINPWINVVGCTTPAWLAQYTNSAHFIKGGFASRVIFVHADHKEKYLPYPKRSMPRNIGELRDDLIEDLREIALSFGEYTITEDAFQWGERWYMEHHQNPPQALRGDIFGGYLDRKQTHLHKLAMVLSASKRGDLTITVDDLREADNALSDLEPDLPAIFSVQATESIAGLATALFRAVQAHGPISRRELFRMFMREIGYETFDKGVTGLTESGLVRLEQVPGQGVMVIETGEYEKRLKKAGD